MYTYIVFESCSISLCKYKCITFQILQHMLIAILNNKKNVENHHTIQKQCYKSLL